MDVAENERELFCIEEKIKLVKALGIQIDANPDDVHIYVNGKDLMKNVVLDTLLVTVSEPKKK